jgi:hypothetical protein
MTLQGNDEKLYSGWPFGPAVKQPPQLQDQAQVQLVATWPTPSPSPGEQFPDPTQNDFTCGLQLLPDPFAPAFGLQNSSGACSPMVRQQMPLTQLPLLRPPPQEFNAILPISNTHSFDWTAAQPQGVRAHAGMAQLSQYARQASQPETAPLAHPESNLRIKRSTPSISMASVRTPTGPTIQQRVQARVDQRHDQRKAEAVVELHRHQREQASIATSVRRRDEDQAKFIIKAHHHEEEHKRKRVMETRRCKVQQAYERTVEANRQQAIGAAKEKQCLAQELQTATQEQQRFARKQQMLYNDQVERQRLLQEQKLEHERKLCRREQLRRDPSALYRHYNEYLEFFPLSKGEYRSQYHNNLLANRCMPIELDSDLSLAIQYAKDNWELFLQYPKGVEEATKWQKEKLGMIAMRKGSKAAAR